MRILLATDTFLPEVNGVTTVLAMMRAGLRHRGHEVLVLAPSYGTLTDDEAGVIRRPAIPCPGYGQVRLSWPWGGGLSRRVAEFDPDLIHAVTEGPLGSFGRWQARQRGVPLVSSFHTDFPRYARRYLGPLAVRPTWAWLRRFHAVAGMTQTPSQTTRDELLAQGIPNPVVWGRGVDTGWFRPDRRSAARRAALGAGDGVVVLHVGRLAVEKDVDTLVRAFQLARERLGPNAHFWVAGDGPRAAAVRGALPFARHLGFVDRSTLAELYADADLFVFPSPTETCGLVALEALASGIPVIGAAAGGVPENIREGITGRLVPPGDAAGFAAAIADVALDAPGRHAMREAARAFAVGRDWARELDDLEATYERLITASAPAAAPSSWPTTTSVG